MSITFKLSEDQLVKILDYIGLDNMGNVTIDILKEYVEDQRKLQE